MSASTVPNNRRKRQNSSSSESLSDDASADGGRRGISKRGTSSRHPNFKGREAQREDSSGQADPVQVSTTSRVARQREITSCAGESGLRENISYDRFFAADSVSATRILADQNVAD